jgi:hypothetical protein
MTLIGDDVRLNSKGEPRSETELEVRGWLTTVFVCTVRR